jgi:ankyrin repeat protein
MPTKRLPSRPNVDQLKHQAKDLVAEHRAGTLQACQRIREFHPRYAAATDNSINAATFALSDAQLTIAREYGFASWARLSTFVREASPSDLERPHHERIADLRFRQAVELLDDGNVEGLRRLLADVPSLATQRVYFEGGNYFREPSLLEFVAENPVRHDGLPPNIVDVARAILEAGAQSDHRLVQSTLSLVSSGRVARECGVQIALVNILCDYGANPDAAVGSALGHGEFEAVNALIARGASVDLRVAAATGRLEEARTTATTASAEDRHFGFALATQFGHAAIVKLLLDLGENPNRFNPQGAHSHSTPLHQAAFAGHDDTVRLLVEHGARLDIKDILWAGTPADWADYGGHSAVAAYLRASARARTTGSPRGKG